MENEVQNKNDPGLIDLISDAMSEIEIKDLVIEGKTEYKNASPKTIKRWDKVAKRRISELNASEPTPSVEKKKLVKK